MDVCRLQACLRQAKVRHVLPWFLNILLGKNAASKALSNNELEKNSSQVLCKVHTAFLPLFFEIFIYIFELCTVRHCTVPIQLHCPSVASHTKDGHSLQGQYISNQLSPPKASTSFLVIKYSVIIIIAKTGSIPLSAQTMQNTLLRVHTKPYTHFHARHASHPLK